MCWCWCQSKAEVARLAYEQGVAEFARDSRYPIVITHETRVVAISRMAEGILSKMSGETTHDFRADIDRPLAEVPGLAALASYYEDNILRPDVAASSSRARVAVATGGTSNIVKVTLRIDGRDQVFKIRKHSNTQPYYRIELNANRLSTARVLEALAGVTSDNLATAEVAGPLRQRAIRAKLAASVQIARALHSGFLPLNTSSKTIDSMWQEFLKPAVDLWTDFRVVKEDTTRKVPLRFDCSFMSIIIIDFLRMLRSSTESTSAAIAFSHDTQGLTIQITPGDSVDFAPWREFIDLLHDFEETKMTRSRFDELAIAVALIRHHNGRIHISSGIIRIVLPDVNIAAPESPPAAASAHIPTDFGAASTSRTTSAAAAADIPRRGSVTVFPWQESGHILERARSDMPSPAALRPSSGRAITVSDLPRSSYRLLGAHFMQQESTTTLVTHPDLSSGVDTRASAGEVLPGTPQHSSTGSRRAARARRRTERRARSRAAGSRLGSFDFGDSRGATYKPAPEEGRLSRTTLSLGASNPAEAGEATPPRVVRVPIHAVIADDEPSQRMLLGRFLPRAASRSTYYDPASHTTLRGVFREVTVLTDGDDLLAFLQGEPVGEHTVSSSTVRGLPATASATAESLRQLAARVNIIFSDNLMPRKTGIQVAREFADPTKRFLTRTDTPFVLVTGSPEGEEIVSHTIVKPCGVPAFTQAITEQVLQPAARALAQRALTPRISASPHVASRPPAPPLEAAVARAAPQLASSKSEDDLTAGRPAAASTAGAAAAKANTPDDDDDDA